MSHGEEVGRHGAARRDLFRLSMAVRAWDTLTTFWPSRNSLPSDGSVGITVAAHNSLGYKPYFPGGK
jgi:hypothetical protein